MRLILSLVFLFLLQDAYSQFAYAPNRNSNNISVINTITNAVVATLPGGVQPQGSAVNRPLNRVYISNNGSSTISVIDPCSNTIVATIPCPGPGQPAGIAVSPNGQRLYVPMFNSNKLHVINAVTNTLITSITTATISVSSPEACVVSPDNSRVYLTLFDENKLAVIDAATNTVLSYQNTDSRPVGADISNDGTKLYVANQNTSSLIVFNTSTWARIATISFGPFSPLGVGGAACVTLNHANTFAYVTIQETSQVKVINTATNTIVNTISVGTRPFGLDIMYDDSRLYVACVDANRVDVINTATNTNIQSIPVGQAPFSYGKFISQRNIDSVRFNFAPTACRAFSFQGLAYTFGAAAITSWEWTFGDGNTANTQNASNTYASNGTYPVKLVITDAFGCKDSITRSLNTVPGSIDAGSDTAVCSGVPFNLHAWGNNLSGWSWTPAGAVNNPNAQNPVATITALTKFYVTATHSSGCTYTDSVTVSVKPLPNINTIPDTAICQFTTVQLTTTGGVGYSWSPPTGLDNPNIGNPVSGTLVPIKYYVTGTGANGCTNIDSVSVTLKPAPTVNTIPDTSFCNNTTLQLTTTGTATGFSWTPATGLSNPSISNPIANPLVPTKYYVTGTGANGCTNIDSVMVTPKALPNVNTIPDTAICNQASVQLTTTGAAGYSWSPATGLSNPSISNPVASPLVPTKYYVTGTGANGCTNIDSVTVSFKPSPNINTIPDTAICQFTTVQLTTTGGVSYSWSPSTGLSNANIGNPIAGPLVPIKYYVTGTGANGCTNIDSVSVTLKPAPTVNTIPDTSFCNNTTLQLTTTGTATGFSWTPATGLSNPSISNPIATPLVPTKYYVTGTGANGCTNIDSVMVTPKALPNVNTIPDTAICNQTSVQLTTTGAAGYSWSPTTGLSNSSIASPTASPLVLTKYYVTGTGANGCTNIDSVTVSLKPIPVINTIPDTAICERTSVQLTTTGGVSYSWSPATGLSNASIGNPIASPLVPAKYYVTGTGANGCTSIDSVTVSLKTLPSVNTTPDTSFCGTTSNIQLNTTGAVSYSWSPAGGLSNPSIGNPIASPAITTKYYVTGTGANGCTNIDSVTIAQKALPLVNTIPDTTVCPGSGVQLTTTGASGYSWTPTTGLSNPNIASPVASPSVPIKYYVTGTGANGCKNIDSVMVGIGSALAISTTPDTSICAQTSIQFQTTGATNYTWTPITGLSNPTIANPIASPAVSTKYYVTGTNGTGCAGIDSVTVTLNLPPPIVTTPDTLLCGAGSVQLNTTGGTNYFWFPPFGLSDPTIGNPVATPIVTTQYIVTGFGANGCVANDTVNIRIGFSVKNGLLLPSAFTPNGDGVNDCFGIRFYEGITELEFRIFNRWGENVFYTTNPSACWDGRFRGKVNPGNYVYYLKAKTACTEPLKIKGNVILIR